MLNIKDIVIPSLGDDQDVAVNGFSIKNIINIIYIGLDENGLQFAFKESNLNLSENGVALIKGPMGAVGITKLATFTVGVILVLVTLFVVQNLVDSHAGRAIRALRDNRIAAESVGIGVTKYKLMAFVTSAALAGAAGALYALNYTGVAAKKFDFIPFDKRDIQSSEALLISGRTASIFSVG